MGSGIFLAAVVLLWFIVLVPMVLTRRDTAIDKAARDNESRGARILRRGKKRPRRRATMSTSESSPSQTTTLHDDEPIESFDDMVDTGVHERYTDAMDEAEPEAEVHTVRAPRRTDTAREAMLRRRRRTLMVLTALIAITLVLSVFVVPWLWIVNAAFDLMGAAYLWHLRGEARREEERRLLRAQRHENAYPHDGIAGAGTRQSFAAGAFAASEAMTDEFVAIDDQDLAFYDVAEVPVSDQVDESTHAYYAHADVAAEYYAAEDEVPGQTAYVDEDDRWELPKAAGA